MRRLLFCLLVACACAQNSGDLESVIQQIFGTPNTTQNNFGQTSQQTQATPAPIPTTVPIASGSDLNDPSIEVYLPTILRILDLKLSTLAQWGVRSFQPTLASIQ
ncbi:hypothetical protein EVAR_18580_1 [Eumeta japonica]|uniref:Uncharacterized protein n=1 Tax=Eumeta variegata TaxID=151549 RepID=A0A4C1V3H8_EUMVA|nr:hypothetical protein EVAR_18580_1 [Eumeta japonica]